MRKRIQDRGSRYHVQISTSGGGVSIVVPDPSPLHYRACLDSQRFRLLQWFAEVEALAWAVVNATCGKDRPKEIFLVTGQTLSPGYSIAHLEEEGSSVHLDIETLLKPPTGKLKETLMGYAFQRVFPPTTGFQMMRTRSDRLFSLFLQVHKSRPQTAHPFTKSLQRRLSSVFR